MIAPESLATRPSHLRSRKSFDHSPMLVFYELTQACDLVYLHCRACAQKRSDPAELSNSDSKRLIDQLTEFPEPPMLILTGGDGPLAYLAAIGDKNPQPHGQAAFGMRNFCAPEADARR